LRLIVLVLCSFINVTESCEYSLPYFTGTTHRTLQGFNGKYSHQAPLQYGVDFEMKVGTKVYAARSGIVENFKSDSHASGKDKTFLNKSNYIKIKHSDDTIAFYAHLKKDGVLVKKEQKVTEGELIGLSGCTGFCDGPHLHFEVYERSENRYKRKSIPIRFISGSGVISSVKRQVNYKAVKNLKPCD
jgi:murein DD-endopeptidase MepM/ murein hydrolase activator NlpD